MADPSIPKPPVGASRHRRWRVWFDSGVLYNGSCVVPTGWYAKGPGGDIIEAHDWNALLAGVDEIEDALGRDQGERLASIVYDPPRPPGPYTVWQASIRPIIVTPTGENH